MKLRVLGCAGTLTKTERTVGFLLDGRVLVDAGTVVTALTVAEQRRIDDVVLSHAHLDHIKELPFFVGDRWRPGAPPLRIHGLPPVLAAVRRHLFNGAVWPDLAVLPSKARPLIRYVPMRARVPVRIGGLTFTLVPVSHAVPCAGMLIDSRGGTVVYTSDTGPTTAIWREARKRDVRAVLVETSFPNAQEGFARMAGHLTPALLEGEMRKLGMPEVPIHVYHLKPEQGRRIRRELAALGPRVKLLRQGRTYEF